MIHYKYFSESLNPHANAAVGSFVSTVIWGSGDHLDKHCSMGVFDGCDIIAGTVYHNYHPDEGVIELTSASTSKKWLTKPIIRAMFSMPFEMLSCQMVVLRVSARNHTMCRIARSFGFDEYIIPRLRGRDEDECIYTLTDDQWKAHKLYKG